MKMSVLTLANDPKIKEQPKKAAARAPRQAAVISMLFITSALLFITQWTWPIHSPPRDLATPTPKTRESTSSVKANENASVLLARGWNYNSTAPCHSLFSIGGPANNGLFMVKPSKTGGSTAASINLRIASTLKPGSLCQARFNHGTAFSLQYATRDRTKSFLWTVLREPTARFVSEFFFFQVSRLGVTASDENFYNYVHNGGRGKFSHYFNVLSLTKFNSTDMVRFNSTDMIQTVNSIMHDYDFIGVTERMDESAVALQMLLKLPTASVIYASSKVNGGYDDGLYQNTCYKIQKSSILPFMKQYFESNMWKEKNKWAAVLYQTANRSLDLTIDRLG